MRKVLCVLILLSIVSFVYSSPSVYQDLLAAENAARQHNKLIFLCFFSSESDSDTFFTGLNSDDELSGVLSDSYIPVSLNTSKSINKQIFALFGLNDVPSAAILNKNGYLLDSLTESHLDKSFILSDKLKNNRNNSNTIRRIDYSEVYDNVKISHRINSAPSGASVYLAYEGGSREYYGKTPLTVKLKPGDYILTIKSAGLSDYSKTISLGLEEASLTYNLLGAKSIISFNKEAQYHPDFEIKINGSTTRAAYDKQYTIGSGNNGLYVNGSRVNYNFTAGHSYEITPVFEIPKSEIRVEGLKPLPEPPEPAAEYRNEYVEIPRLFTVGGMPQITVLGLGIGVTASAFSGKFGYTLAGLACGVGINMVINAIIGGTFSVKTGKKIKVENVDEINRDRQYWWSKKVAEVTQENDKIINEEYRNLNNDRGYLIINNITNGSRKTIRM